MVAKKKKRKREGGRPKLMSRRIALFIDEQIDMFLNRLTVIEGKLKNNDPIKSDILRRSILVGLQQMITEGTNELRQQDQSTKNAKVSKR